MHREQLWQLQYVCKVVGIAHNLQQLYWGAYSDCSVFASSFSSFDNSDINNKESNENENWIMGEWKANKWDYRIQKTRTSNTMQHIDMPPFTVCVHVLNSHPKASQQLTFL